MAKYRATIRLYDLTGADPAAVQHQIEERMKQSGVERWRTLGIEVDGGPRPPRREALAQQRRARDRADGRAMLVVAGAAWLIWFFWYLIEY